MKYLKLYENFDSFFKDPMYGILLSKDNSEFQTSFERPQQIGIEMIDLAIKLVNFLNENNVDFRVYYVIKGDKRFDPVPDDNYIIFLFNRNVELDDGVKISSVVRSPAVTDFKLEDIPSNIEVARMPDNDIEFYFTVNKYNL